ncbi:MAG: calcium:proton antiporter [Deltaproteobacteria bacterium]|nr:calcium:proton antiporter [Deltaproteobacteria bacterium]
MSRTRFGVSVLYGAAHTIKDYQQERSSMTKRVAEDAKRWVDTAVAFYRASGKRIALAEYTNPNGQFVQDEMYIYALNPKGTMLAHGVNEKFVGEEFIDIKDYDGKEFIKEIIDIANREGSGWVTYKWYNPVTKEVLPKTVFFRKVDDLIICSGVYGE